MTDRLFCDSYALRSRLRSGTFYSAAYMSRRDQKHFTISKVAADWHELMIPQRTMRPSIARVSEQLDPRLQLADIPPPQSATLGLRFAASRHAIAPITARLLRKIAQG